MPLLLHFWGVQLYGEWLMLAAIPAYLAIGDGGFAQAASREMGMRSGAGDRNGALVVFQSTACLLGVVSLAVFVGMVGVVQHAPISDWLGFDHMSREVTEFVLLLLVVHVLVGFQGGLINGGFWCSGKYPLGMALASTTQLVEFAALATAVVLGGGPLHAAIAYLAGRCVGTAITRFALLRATPWLHYGITHVSVGHVRRLVAPAVASLAFPLGNALNIQGMRLIVGLVLGPAAVAVFAPVRTLSNLVTQPRVVVNRLLQPELGLAFGAGEQRLFNVLFLRGSQTALWLCVTVAAGILLVTPWIWSVWTGGQLPLPWPLFVTLVTAALINSLWYTALMVPYATNRHGRIAVVYTLVYGLGALAFGYFGGNIGGLAGAGAGLLVAEIAMAAYVLPVALRMGNQHWTIWLSSIVQPPTFLLSRVTASVFHALQWKTAK